MKNQLFYLFYEKENDMNLKLIKTYVNRFIIDDEAECEIKKAYELTKPPDFEFSEITLIRKFQNLFSYNKLMTISELLKHYPISSTDDQNMQVHYIFALSFDFDMLFFLLAVPNFVHCSILRHRSKSFLSEKELKRELRKKRFTNSLNESYINNSNVTIGDDIEFFIDQFRNMTSNPYIWEQEIVYHTLSASTSRIFYREIEFFTEKFRNMTPNPYIWVRKIVNQTLFVNIKQYFTSNNIFCNQFVQDFEYWSISKEFEDHFLKIKCQRKFIPRPSNMVRSFVFIFILSILRPFGLLFLGNQIRRKIFNPRHFSFDKRFPITLCLFLIWGLGSLLIDFIYFQEFVQFFQNIIFVLEAMLMFGFPNTWVHIANILNPLLLCLYLYMCYVQVSRNYYSKTLLNYFKTYFFE